MDNKRGLAGIILAFCLVLSACEKSAEPAAPATPSLTSTPKPTQTTTFTPTATPTEIPWWLTPRPRNMESYGLTYEPKTTPRVPPLYSVDMHIWGNEIPYKLIEGTPQFSNTFPPGSQVDSKATIEAAGCKVAKYGFLECPADSPLAQFGCEYTYISFGVLSVLGINGQYAATWSSSFEDEDQPRVEYLYRVGCAFRKNSAHIFKVDQDYQLISNPAELQKYFGRIESPEEALTFAQVMTGLKAKLFFEYDESLLYFQDNITGTRVTEVPEGYLLNLFHFNVCSCEPWITSQVTLQVSYNGEITWLEAIPLWMTTGFGCAD